MKPMKMYISITNERGGKYYIFAQSRNPTVVVTSDNGGIKVEGSTIKESLQKAFEGMKRF
ncbi:hypothetical protein MHI57_16150 [Cytobacillus sp. FSL K6-0129]|uniref:hypothetical protein n=1 Tax=Cytobacillus sp. FSL K6-0129 TaxID=2921421 RepID=UPI0030FAE192